MNEKTLYYWRVDGGIYTLAVSHSDGSERDIGVVNRQEDAERIVAALNFVAVYNTRALTERMVEIVVVPVTR